MAQKKNKWQSGKLLLLIAAAFLFMFVELRPELQPLRDSAAYDILFRLVISGLILYFTFFRKKKPSRPALTALVAAAWLPWQILVLPFPKLTVACVTLLGFSGVGILVYEQIRFRKHTEPLLYVTMFVLLLTVTFAQDYTFVDVPNSFRYWQLSLLSALVCGAGAFWLVFRGILVLKDDRMSEKIAFGLGGLMLGFFLMYPLPQNLNYILDTSKPVYYQMPVVDKDINTGGKSTTYYLYLEFRGQEISMTVSQSDYYRYALGDLVPVTLYQGAFDDPYYIME